MSIRGKNRDKNERVIIDALRMAGASVEQHHRPVDLLVGFRGVNYLMEVKSPPGPRGGASKDGQKLNEDQREFFATWGGQVAMVTTWQEAFAVIGIKHA